MNSHIWGAQINWKMLILILVFCANQILEEFV